LTYDFGMQNSFYANGKLLLTAEYAVLDGAKALALPTRLGQSLQFGLSDDENGHWKSYDADGSLWFEADFSTKNYEILKTNDAAIAQNLVKILQTCRQLKAETHPTDIQNQKSGIFTPPQYKPLSVTTHLTFPRQWGLGTSSTLIFSLANLFKINAFDLLEHTFGGSGYDLACAGVDQSLVFWRDNQQPHFELVDFHPPFADQLFFIYLGKKQNSREGIARYRQKKQALTTRDTPPQYLAHFSALTNAFLTCEKLEDFDNLIIEHENLVSELVELPRAQSLYFNDFWGQTKSLGAWGGDFVLATSNRPVLETTAYFQQKGFKTVLTYAELIK
jgi:mevalonate kinase